MRKHFQPTDKLQTPSSSKSNFSLFNQAIVVPRRIHRSSSRQLIIHARDATNPTEFQKYRFPGDTSAEKSDPLGPKTRTSRALVLSNKHFLESNPGYLVQNRTANYTGYLLSALAKHVVTQHEIRARKRKGAAGTRFDLPGGCERGRGTDTGEENRKRKGTKNKEPRSRRKEQNSERGRKRKRRASREKPREEKEEREERSNEGDSPNSRGF